MHRSYLILTTLINTVTTIVEVILGLRFVLKLFGANPVSPFVNWIYSTSRPLLEPFIGMFPSPVIEGGFILEFTTLFALIAYALVAFLLIRLVDYVFAIGHRYDHKHPHE